MREKKVVFVCHYFPPQDNVGIRRVTFWANFFSQNGYEVTVITTKKRNSELLFNEVDKRVNVIEFSFCDTSLVCKSNELNISRDSSANVLKRGSKVGPLVYFKRKFINPIFGQIADYRLFNVLGFMIQYHLGLNSQLLKQYVCSSSTIISTAPPWPVHLLGGFLKKKFCAKHIVDYRDPFSNNHMFSSFFTKLENLIDKIICRRADFVVTVSPSWVDLYSNKTNKVKLIRNGFDISMFEDKHDILPEFKQNLELNYFGTIEHPERFPSKLISYLEKSQLNITINFYGRCPLIYEYISKNTNLKSKIKLMGHKPYNETIAIMKNSDFNLVCESIGKINLSEKGLIPTKIYEYIACKRPIVAILDPDSDAVKLLSQTGLLAHKIEEINNLDRLFGDLKHFSIKEQGDFDIIELSRQFQTKTLIELEQELHKHAL
jgi:hypothetical protein